MTAHALEASTSRAVIDRPYSRLLAVLAASLVWMLAPVCSSSALAQIFDATEHREWEVSTFGGWSFTGKRELPTRVSGSSQESSRTVGMEHHSGYQLGLRVTENFDEFWAADLEYSFANQDLRFTNLSPSVQSLSVGQYIHHFTYNVSALPLPRTDRFRPYGEVGIGAALFYIPGSGKRDALELGLALRDSWKFVFNWGGGFKYLVKDQFALSLDLKNRLSGVPSYGLPESGRVVDGQYQSGISARGLLQNWQINFGLTFQWDEY